MLNKRIMVFVFILAQLLTISNRPGRASYSAKALGNQVPDPQMARITSSQTTITISGPLSVSNVNPRYFADPDGTIVYLTGSHTWCDFMDCDDTYPIAATFNYTAYLDFLVAHNHNFFRLWRAENARGGEAGPNFWFDPMPYQRSNVCCAFDGGKKFDLTQFNQAYFDRMRQRVIAARDRGIYVSIMLFDGWSVESKIGNHQPWAGHPYNLNNNVNNIDGDTNNDNQGGETHTLSNSYITSQITPLQEAYVRKVIDTVNDLDNVLYEISNESTASSSNNDWQYHMINYIKNYEASKPNRHPVGMTYQWPGGNNSSLYNSPADWISLGGGVDINTYVPPAANGSKVIIADTDHLCGICGNRQWVWKSFTRGENPAFMDVYDPATSSRGAYLAPTGNEAEIRDNMGYTRQYANRMNLAAMTPQPALCSTGYCLAKNTANNAEFLAFLPGGGSINLNLNSVSGNLSVEWFNPATNTAMAGADVGGGATRTLSAPFGGDAVVYLKSIVPPPPHDDFNSARTVSGVPYENIVDIAGATVASDDPIVPAQCDGKYLAKGARSVWYQYTAPASGQVYLDTRGSSPVNFDTYIAVWTGARGSLNFVACDNNSTDKDAQLILNTSAGTTYFIEVAEYTGTQGGSSVPAYGGTLSFHATTFADVPGDYWAWRYIEGISAADITTGCNDVPKYYCPASVVNRAQMAVFLLRGIHGSSYVPPDVNGDSGFNDVPADAPTAPWIKQLAAEGITGGCGNGNYCPDAPVSRAQMAIFLLRAEHGSSYVPPDVGNNSGFNDVPSDSPFAPWIKQLVTEGTTAGCGNGNYCPNNSVSRDQMAIFLSRTFNFATLP